MSSRRQLFLEEIGLTPLWRLKARDGAAGGDGEQDRTVAVAADSAVTAKPAAGHQAIDANDMTLLTHTGLYSIQLQSPGSQKLPDVKPGANPDEPNPPEGKGTPPPVPAEAPPVPPVRSSVADVLTTRERELAELVADGLTNKEIGARAGVSERTVERVIASASGKLGASSRAQLAALIGGARVAA